MDNQGQRRTSNTRPMDNGDPRIPMAWRHREMTFNHAPYPRHQSSPSVTSSSSTDDRDEVPMVRQHYRPLSRHSNIDRTEERIDHYATIHNERPDCYVHEYPHNFSSSRSDRMDTYSMRATPTTENFHGHQYRHHPVSGTLRSTRSVPSLAFAAVPMENADPCPVHGENRGGFVRRHGSLFDLRAPPMGGPLSIAGLDKKSFHGSKHSMINGHPPIPHPAHMVPGNFASFHSDPPQYAPPHMMRHPSPHHQLMGMPMMIDPASLRDPFRKMHHHGPAVYPKKDIDPYSVEQVCCKGHLIVLWIILGVVTVGVILGIIMGVTIT